MIRGRQALMSLEWWSAALLRAVRTAAQVLITSSALALGGDSANLWQIDWQLVIGLVLGTALLSLCTSLAGLPEVGSATENGGGHDDEEVR